MKQLILLSSNVLTEKVTWRKKHLCVDYDTLEISKVTSSDIIQAVDRNESYLGLDYGLDSTIKIIESFLPYSKYKGKGYKVICEEHRLVVETDDRHVFRLDMKDNTLRFMSKVIVIELGGSKLPVFKYRWCYIKDGVLRLSISIISYIIEIQIQNNQALVDIQDAILISELWSIQEYINQIYN